MTHASSVSSDDHAVDVAALDGVGEAPDQSALAGGVRARGALAVGGRQPLLEGCPGALQGALHRDLARVEHLGDLGGAEAEHVAQHECRALAGRQPLQRDDERKLDRLPGLVARRRPGGAVGDVLEQDVGVGLEPDRLAPSGGLGRLIHGLDLPWAARPGAQRVQAAVGRDPVKPGAHRRSALERLEAPPCRKKRLLHQVLGVLQRAEDAVAVQLQLAPVGFGELAKRLLVPRPRPRERGLV